MAEKFLNRSEIVAALEQVGREGMPEAMAGCWLDHAGNTKRVIERSLENRFVQVMAKAAAGGVDVGAGLLADEGDGGVELLVVGGLDATRREAGVRQRPTFDVNGQRLLGSQPYETFAAIINGAQP